ncbi:MAG: hypothetical protein A3B70_06670 [Deltaproteobacteria bacterium RIFCSPHIGHO2_02_FULL_40_11]|nr:MAG: hypothetical protein A3B70_06670 [Deltaproteobacteria bacterium RIFCSPHIGHO2_02_FULL_40_11]
MFRKIIFIFSFLFLSTVLYAQSKDIQIRILKNAPIYALKPAQNGYQFVIQDFDQDLFEMLLGEVKFAKENEQGVILAEQALISRLEELNGERFYKVGLGLYIPESFIEVIAPEEIVVTVSDEGKEVPAYAHTCATGVCYEKLKTPMHLETISNTVGDVKLILSDLDPNLILQAEKCLGENCLTQDERRSVLIGLVAPDAQDTYQKYGIPASITIAQAIQESGWGKKPIREGEDPETHQTVQAHNFFGVKARENEPAVLVTTHEEQNGKRVKVVDRFRRYNNLGESIDHHAEVLVRQHFLDKYRKNGFLGRATDFYDPKTGTVQQYFRGTEDITKFLNILQHQVLDEKGNPTEFTYATDSNYVSGILGHIDFRKNRLQRFDTFDGLDHK